jgi:hypothetical protein
MRAIANALGSVVWADNAGLAHDFAARFHALCRIGPLEKKMDKVVSMSKLSLSEFEKFHRARVERPYVRPTVKEVFLTVALIFFMTPFFFVTATIIPLMGPITVLFAMGVSCIYLWSRRSWLIGAVALGSTIAFWSSIFGVIQLVKNDLDVVLFIFTALGIPVSVMFSVFVATRIWTLRGGVD